MQQKFIVRAGAEQCWIEDFLEEDLDALYLATICRRCDLFEFFLGQFRGPFAGLRNEETMRNLSFLRTRDRFFVQDRCVQYAHYMGCFNAAENFPDFITGQVCDFCIPGGEGHRYV